MEKNYPRKLAERLFKPYGGNEILKDEGKRQIFSRLSKEMIKGRGVIGVIKDYFKSQVPHGPKLTKEQIANRLLEMKLANDLEDANDLTSEVISSEFYQDKFEQITEPTGKIKYQFIRYSLSDDY